MTITTFSAKPLNHQPKMTIITGLTLYVLASMHKMIIIENKWSNNDHLLYSKYHIPIDS